MCEGSKSRKGRGGGPGCIGAKPWSLSRAGYDCKERKSPYQPPGALPKCLRLLGDFMTGKP